MKWSRVNGRWVGQHTMMDATATVSRAARTYRGAWFTRVYLYGEEVGTRYTGTFADAKAVADEILDEAVRSNKF